jgi:hypothetical protein
MKAQESKNAVRSAFPQRLFCGKAERLLMFIGFFILTVFGINNISGQTPTQSPDKVQTAPVKTPDADQTDKNNSNPNDQNQNLQLPQDQTKKTKRGTWIFAPIPINSPAFGAGLVLGVGYLFKVREDDKVSPPSTLAAATAFTNNGSRGLILGAKLYFSENKYQTTIAVGKGRANYEFFGTGRIPGRPPVSVDIEQQGQFIFAEFMRNFGKNIFIGPRYQYRKLTGQFGDRSTASGIVIPAFDLTSNTAALGFHVQRDTRDSTFYPRRGALLDFKGDFFAKPLGSNRNYQAYSLSYNGYRSLNERSVLAYRGVVCSVSDRTPFFDLCLYGAKGDIRGYTAGEFQNHRMWATQVEYRRELPRRFGLVGFAGIGSVARHWDKLRLDELLPGAGIGLRYKLDKVNHINYRIDLGFGRGGHTLSFSVTEAF